jgi:hypothetical protein
MTAIIHKTRSGEKASKVPLTQTKPDRLEEDEPKLLHWIGS